MNFNENYVVVKINLTSVDKALDTLWSFNGIKVIAGGDIVRVKLKCTVSVIGNAGYQKSTMAYDSVDNPAPNPDQVANLVLDVLDELLAEMNFNENYVVVKINLTSVDNALDTLWSFNGIKGIAGGDIVRMEIKIYGFCYR